MLRYANVVILAGGKSERMGFCKSEINFKKIKLLENQIYLISNIGFSFVFISGIYKKYLNKNDILYIGPYAGIYTYKNGTLKNSCIFFITVDMPCVNELIFFSLIIKMNKKYSYFYTAKIFPFIIGNSNISNHFVFKFMKFGNSN